MNLIGPILAANSLDTSIDQRVGDIPPKRKGRSQGRVTAISRPAFEREGIEAEIDRVRSLGVDSLRTLWRTTVRSSLLYRPITFKEKLLHRKSTMPIATRPLMFLKSVTMPIAYAFAGFILIRPFLLRNGLIRKFIFKTIGRTTKTLVYSKIKMEHFLVHSADTEIGMHLFAFGERQFRDFILAIDLCNKNLNGRKKPIILIDAGANIGSICVPAVARGFVQRAVAIEPEPLNCRLLRANIALNGLSNSILVHEFALGASTDDELTLELSETNLGDHRIRVNTEDRIGLTKIQVKSETLDGLCPAIDYSDSLLWMDIQGYEGFALSGGKELLKSRIPLVFEFWPHGMKRAGSLGALKAAVAHYDGYFDLHNPDKIKSIDTLDDLYRSIGEEPNVKTDILIL